MTDKDTIDLQDLIKTMVANRVKLLFIITVFTGIALLLAVFLPKQYESSVVLRTKSKQPGISLQAAAAVSLLAGVGPANPIQTYIEMITSRTVLEPVLENSELPGKEKMTTDSFAEKYIKVKNEKNTELIEITVSSRSPQEAQKITKDVLTSFQKLLSKLNQTEQSLQLRFLGDRLAIAKTEMESAESALEDFRQKAKVYVPDDQAKSLIRAITELDQKVAQFSVERDANQAKLFSINEKLKQHNTAAAAYAVADNSSVDKLKQNIIDRKVQLITLRQRYTDDHPEVQLITREIEEISQTLNKEIDRSIQSGISSLTPIQAELVKEKLVSEIAVVAADAGIRTVKTTQGDVEKSLGKLSANGLTYIGLERRAKIAQEVYMVLVKSYEQARIQEAMESMDVQVIDPPNIPKYPAGPSKMLFSIVGLLLGFTIGVIYSLVLQSRANRAV